jgi:alpha-N-acetylglucosaminidase
VVVLWIHDPLISSSSSSSSLPAFVLEQRDSAGSDKPPIHHRSKDKDDEYDNDNDKLEPVYQLINRVLHYNHSRRDFQLALLSSKANSDTISPCRLPCFSIQDQSSIQQTQQQQQQQQQHHRISIQGGPTVSELTAGIGWYLRHVAHISGLDIWPSYLTNTVPRAAVFLPNWPIPVGEGVVLTHHRQVPYSHLMNVCTHSYSLVWYSADDWIRFIDWMALSGINMMLALTGQEWIQYQVFRTMGLSDRIIREWFNGPAFLTWSRGQNEYGSNIGGPLPISWMKDQWNLQRDVILPLIRQLDIIGQLPAFQGNVPIQLKDIYHDANITQQGGTGWMDSLDPLFGQVANRWMETLIRDFGTDHWYQLDGYFNGGTAPWFQQTGNDISMMSPSPPIDHHDELWYQRGVHAYQGLNQTDPDAIWSFQGFAIVGWETPEQASYFRGFVDSVPSKDKFVIMDMSYDPQQPEWAKWNRSAFFGASFVWNALHNFGGTDGIKGDMQKVNRMPFDALNISGHARPIGLGATPEGITQNPAYYQFLYEQAFQQGPIPNLTSHLILQMHQRYGVDPKYHFDPDIALSWTLLLEPI